MNLSSEPWDGPLSLHDMFCIKDKKILSMVENYRIHLIDPHTMSNEELEKFNTNLREVMTFIKYQKDKKKLREMTEINPRFKNIKRDAKRMIEVCTHWKFKEAENEQEEVDMCQALREMVEDAREEGRQEMCQALFEIKEEGREEGRDATLADNLKAIMESFGVTLERAFEVLNVPVEKYEYYRKLV